jgi:hypothetical protein
VKRKAALIVLVAAIVTLLSSSVAVAGTGGRMTKVYNDWSGYGYYMASGKSGVIHEWFFCDSNWQNCPGRWVYFEMAKHPNPPICDAGGIGPSQINLWNVGDGSDILHPGWYWICSYDYGGEIFRASE